MSWQALKTREEMRAAGVPADPVTYEALAEASAISGDWRSAEAILREVLASSADEGDRQQREEKEEGEEEGKEEGGRGQEREFPALEDPAREWGERRRRWRRQQLPGVKPTPQLFQLLLEAYSRAGEWERAMACLDDMWSSASGQGAVGGAGTGGVGLRAGFAPDATCFGWAMQVPTGGRILPREGTVAR